jgi:cytochrome P450 family 110
MKPLKSLAGPKAPQLWQLIQWIAHPTQYLERNAHRYGDRFRGSFLRFPNIVFLSDPEALEKLFTDSPEQFDGGSANTLVRPILGNNSLLMLDGERHKRHRQLLMPPFHGDRMRAYGQLICQITEQVTGQWTEHKPFLARSAMQAISLQVMLRAVFGLEEGERYQQLQHLLSSLLDLSLSSMGNILLFFPFAQRDLGSWSPWGRFLEQKRRINQLIYAEIRERRAQPDSSRTDILSVLMAARDAEGQPMTEEELLDELMTLLVAGHETTATALTWALYWIHHLPDVKEKLLHELDTLGADPDPSDITRLPYLSAICSETLRIYPVAIIPTPRIVLSPITFLGYEFEPGTLLIPSIYSAHHRQQTYPNPKQFRPERFLERQFSPYEYLPFGGSNRRCIGAAFALFEMKLILATVMSRFELTLASDKTVQPVRRGPTIAPDSGVPIVMTGKRSEKERLVPVSAK